MSEEQLSEEVPIGATRPGWTEKTPRCVAHKKTGERCRQAPIRGGTVCKFHGGANRHVRAKAQERILAASDHAARRLIEFMNDKKVPYAVRLAATKDLLDRGGLSARHAVDITLSPFEALTERILTAGVEVVEDDYSVIDAEVVESSEDGRGATATLDPVAPVPDPKRGAAPVATATVDPTPPSRLRDEAEDRGKADLS